MPLVHFQTGGGHEIAATTEKWISAILLTLPDAQRARIFALLKDDRVAKPTKGHVLRAEGGHLFAKT